MAKHLLLILLSLSMLTLHAQKIKIKEGNIETLNGVNAYNVVFDYTNVQIPNYESEELFLKDKMAKREEKLVGDGEKFRKSWFADRENLYEPYFIKYFNEYFIKKRKITIKSNNTNAKYTMVVKTSLIYPGYNVVVAWESSKIEAIITVYESNAPDKILFSSRVIKIYQGKSSYNSGERIANSYAVLGRAFAGYLRRKTK